MFRNVLIEMGSIFDFRPREYELTELNLPSDGESIRSDWEAVGNDLYSAMNSNEI